MARSGQTQRPSETPQIFAPDVLDRAGKRLPMDHIRVAREDATEQAIPDRGPWGQSGPHVKGSRPFRLRRPSVDRSGPVLTEHLFAVTMEQEDRELYLRTDDPKHVWRSTRNKMGAITDGAYEEPSACMSHATKSGTFLYLK